MAVLPTAMTAPAVLDAVPPTMLLLPVTAQSVVNDAPPPETPVLCCTAAVAAEVPVPCTVEPPLMDQSTASTPSVTPGSKALSSARILSIAGLISLLAAAFRLGSEGAFALTYRLQKFQGIEDHARWLDDGRMGASSSDRCTEREVSDPVQATGRIRIDAAIGCQSIPKVQGDADQVICVEELLADDGGVLGYNKSGMRTNQEVVQERGNDGSRREGMHFGIELTDKKVKGKALDVCQGREQQRGYCEEATAVIAHLDGHILVGCRWLGCIGVEMIYLGRIL